MGTWQIGRVVHSKQNVQQIDLNESFKRNLSTPEQNRLGNDYESILIKIISAHDRPNDPQADDVYMARAKDRPTCPVRRIPSKQQCAS